MSKRVVETWMSRSLARGMLLIGSLCFAVSACGDVGPNVKVVTLEVAATRVPCHGFVATECIQVREPPAADWTYFYDPIEGFDYQPGFEYTIRVAVSPVLNPPQDGSSRTYRLVAVLRKEPA